MHWRQQPDVPGNRGNPTAITPYIALGINGKGCSGHGKEDDPKIR